MILALLLDRQHWSQQRIYLIKGYFGNDVFSSVESVGLLSFVSNDRDILVEDSGITIFSDESVEKVDTPLQIHKMLLLN